MPDAANLQYVGCLAEIIRCPFACVPLELVVRTVGGATLLRMIGALTDRDNECLAAGCDVVTTGVVVRLNLPICDHFFIILSILLH